MYEEYKVNWDTVFRSEICYQKRSEI